MSSIYASLAVAGATSQNVMSVMAAISRYNRKKYTFITFAYFTSCMACEVKHRLATSSLHMV
jgi:hypothetical protein